MNLPSDPDPHAAEPKQNVEERSPAEFFFVGIGASAGGLDAIIELVKRVPAQSAITLFVVQHLDPEHQSLLVELLEKVSALPVHWVTHGRSIEPGHVYVAPAKQVVSIRQGVALLDEDHRKSGGAIDHLFRSLAEEMRDRAVGVVLSGTGSDGALGLKAIKAAGGVTFAQEISTAAFPGMPRAAIDAGCVDRVLSPGAIGDELLRLTQTARVIWERIGVADETPPQGTEAEHLTAIFRLLAVRTGVDFSDYKQSTIKRRLVRRMVLAKTPELGE